MKTKTPKKRFSPVFETLERRDAMSVTSATIFGGTLKIVADNANDSIEIRQTYPVVVQKAPLSQTAATRSPLFPPLPVIVPSVIVTDKTAVANKQWSFKSSAVKRIEVLMNGGDDRLDSTSIYSTKVYGGDGDDNIFTGSGNDAIYAGLGSDNVVAGAGNDYLNGGPGNDFLMGGAGSDNLYGGLGTNILSGDEGNDFLFPGSRADYVEGGAGYDYLEVFAGQSTVISGETIKIMVPQDQAQNDKWSCGPNSGSRLLRSYGINVSYATLRNQVQNDSRLSSYGLGTLPDTLKDVLHNNKSDTKIETESNLNRVLQLLHEGKPVIALVATTQKPIKFLGAIVGHYGMMHYVVLNGYDEATQTIRYVDTNGAAKSWTLSEFDYHWRWFDHFTGTGESLQGGLFALGMRKRTLIF